VTQHGKDTGICIDAFDITRWCNEVSGDQSVDMADASCFDEPQGAKVYVAGMTDGTYSWSGREQGTVDGLRSTFDALADIEGGSPFTVAIERGFHPGRVAQMGQVLVTSANLSAPVADVVSASGDLQSDGPVMTGIILTKKAPYEAGTDNGTSIDLGSPSVSGTIHIHAVQGTTANGQVTVTVQTSTDQALWTDIGQLVLAAGESLGRSIPVTTPIDRYVRAVVTHAGTSGTAPIRVAIAVRK
jgi:hypothetical protein